MRSGFDRTQYERLLGVFTQSEERIGNAKVRIKTWRGHENLISTPSKSSPGSAVTRESGERRTNCARFSTWKSWQKTVHRMGAMSFSLLPHPCRSPARGARL